MAYPKFLICFSCRNLERFLQISDRGDQRTIHADGSDVVLGAFEVVPDDPRPAGLYCRDCDAPIELDPEAVSEMGLGDLRLDLVDTASFDARSFADRLKTIVPDAEWSEYEEPQVEAQYATLETPLNEFVTGALERTGRDRLYKHQAEGIDAVLAGENVVLATPAGSGKSLVYQVPILNELVTNTAGTALVIAPMKALTGDQLSQMARFSVGNPWASRYSLDLRLDPDARPLYVSRYDGGVAEELKIEARRRGDVVFVTPDMLHHSILRMARKTYKSAGKGTRWYRLLSGLRYIVIDEVHVYRGVFGANVAQVIRRLRRIAEYYGAHPRFIVCSATIGNPAEVAAQVTGIPDFRVIDDDTSGHGKRIHLICNPPLGADRPSGKRGKKAALSNGSRMSPQTVILDLLAKGALAGGELPVASICFGRSRGEVFAIGKRLRERLEVDHKRADLARGVTTYTATLLAEDRADVEKRLREASVSAIVGTNALELGIDIPQLSFGVLAGYPGQRAVFRQRAGRVGRRGEGVVVTVVGDDPLQQYIARNPRTVFEGRPEDAVVNAEARPMIRDYGLEPGEQELDGVAVFDSMFWPEEEVREWIKDLPRSQMRWDHDVERAYYQRLNSYEGVYRNLRNIAGGTYTVYEGRKRSPRPIGLIDEASAPRDCFVPAIYPTFDGSLYRIYDFDRRKSAIYAERVNVSYLTRGVPVDSVEVVEEEEERKAIGDAKAGYGRIQVKRRVFSYKVLNNNGVEESKPVEKHWPETTFETEALWVDLPNPLTLTDLQGATRGVEHVMLAMAPSVVAVDPFDFESTAESTRIYLYDSFAGGMGLAEKAFERLEELLARCLDVIESCTCKTGCPGCVHLSRRPEGNDDIDKQGAVELLRLVVNGEKR